MRLLSAPAPASSLQACLGDIYDVTRGGDFYGPEGPYNKFAGRCVAVCCKRGSTLTALTFLPLTQTPQGGQPGAGQDVFGREGLRA